LGLALIPLDDRKSREEQQQEQADSKYPTGEEFEVKLGF